MGNLGCMELILILVAFVPGCALVGGGILGFLAFRKVRELEAQLKAKNLI
ncbi:hypothetical protein [Geothrix sp. PMB-07]|nr:hypothetical protein [Geothrix sp. PMB-07]WLT30958.1 hypothetical protein Q9293_14670 [Geothrix sp. PMB-07]